MDQGDPLAKFSDPQGICEDEHWAGSIGSIAIRPKLNLFRPFPDNGEVIVEVRINEIAIAQRQRR